eukprot:gene7161-7651_t
MGLEDVLPATDFEENRHLMDLYSRQIGAYGLEAMTKLVQLKVLFVGVTGVGIEAAKNITLAGAHTVALWDENPIELRDLGVNFFLNEKDIGSPKAKTIAPRLAELNPLVRVHSVNGSLHAETLRSYDAVIVSDKTISKKTLIEWNELCRSRTKTVHTDRGEPQTLPNPTSFIYCFTGGVFGSVFVDHGNTFIVRDNDGKDPLVKIIQSIEQKSEEIISDKGEKINHHYTLIRFITPDGQPPGSLPENCLINIHDVDGMIARSSEIAARHGTSITTTGPWRTYSSPSDPVNSVRIGDTSGFTPYIGRGYIKQVKEPHTISFRPFAECITQPSNVPTGVVSDTKDYGFVMIDLMSTFSPGGVEVQIHFALQSVMAFQQKYGRLPTVNNDADCEKCVSLAENINNTLRTYAELTPGAAMRVMFVDNLNKELIRKFARHAAIELQPLCAFFGGVVAQELVKLSGRYTPIRQFFNYHVMEALPDSVPDDTQPLNCRYDDQISVFGQSMQCKLESLRVFMVGCGALGCEFMKNFALMGVSCHPSGRLHVTDNDRIELSNLSRQFLFREDNVGQPKSAAAAKRAKIMNPDLNVVARQDLVAPETEHIFDGVFWEGLDLVLAILCLCNDGQSCMNVSYSVYHLKMDEARLYVDNKCVLFEKPLLESGTMGTGANVDVIVPHITASYSDGGNADAGGGIPMCTLRNFPHLIDHCIEWARAKFNDLFVSPATQLQQFLEDPETFLTSIERNLNQHVGGERTAALERAVDTLRTLKAITMELGDKPNIEICVLLAWKTFHTFFRDAIHDLINTFPADAKTKTGEPFWTGQKKFPSPIEFDKSNTMHNEFLISTANLYACVFKVHPQKYPSEENKLHTTRWMSEYRNENWLHSVVARLNPPEYIRHRVGDLDDNQDIAAANSNEIGSAIGESDDVEEEFEQLKNDLLQTSETLGIVKVEPLDFEKDDDDNFHIDFITSAANLRASNYRIQAASRHKCKMIAGRIVPAIATSTASVTGLVMMELFKILQNKALSSLRNANYDLGSNTFFTFEPPSVHKKRSSTKKILNQSEYESAVHHYNRALNESESKVEELKLLKQQLEKFPFGNSDIKERVEQ